MAIEYLDLSCPVGADRVLWTITGLMSRGTLNCLVAPSGYGKSTFLCQLAIMLASEREYQWLGYRIPAQPQKILYLALEDIAGVKLKLKQLSEVLEDKVSIGLSSDKNDILNRAFDVIIVDNLGDLVGGTITQDNIRRIAQQLANNGITYIFSHHTIKYNQHTYLGSGSLEDVMNSLSHGYFEEEEDNGLPDKQSQRLFVVKKNKSQPLSGIVKAVKVRDAGLSCFIPEIEEYTPSLIDNGVLRQIELTREYYLLEDKPSAIGLWRFVVGDSKRTSVSTTFNRFIRKYLLLKEYGFKLVAKPYLEKLQIEKFYSEVLTGFIPIKGVANEYRQTEIDPTNYRELSTVLDGSPFEFKNKG